MLNAAIAALCLAAPLGMWLSSQYLIEQAPSRFTGKVAAVHGMAGATCAALLFLALRRPVATHPGGPASGAGAFGWIALGMLLATLFGGLTILSFHLRRRAAAPVIVAIHACAGIFAAVLLAAYYSTPSSYGR